MKFIVRKGTDLFEQLIQLNERAEQCFEKTKRIAIKYGNGQWVPKPHQTGGILAIQFDAGKEPKDWVKVFDDEDNLLMPHPLKKSVSSARKRIERLPFVHDQEFGKLLGIKDRLSDFNSMRYIFRPGITIESDFIILEYPAEIPREVIPVVHGMVFVHEC